MPTRKDGTDFQLGRKTQRKLMRNAALQAAREHGDRTEAAPASPTA